jgi:cytochrome c2
MEQIHLKAENTAIPDQISAMKLNQRVICSLLLFLGWAVPAPLFAGPGEALFKEKHCALCHNIKNPGTVFAPVCPGLQGVRHRHSKEWVRKWLKDPAAVWAGNDTDVQDINTRYFRYRGSPPKARESFMATIIGKKVVLTDKEIEALIDYLWKL